MNYKRLDDSNTAVSSATAIGLSPYIVDYPQLRGPIDQVLKESTAPYVQKRILLGLGQSKSEYAVGMIKPYLDSSDIPTKQVAVYSLGLTDDKVALVELGRMIKSDDAVIRAMAIQSFVKVPDASFEVVIPYLEDESQKVRLATVESLSGKVADMPSISDSFIKIAELDSDPLVRSAATLGLGWGNISKSEAIEVIKGNLYSENVGLGQASALALGKIDSVATVEPLLSIAENYEFNHLVRDTAIISLGYKVFADSGIADHIKAIANIEARLYDKDLVAKEAPFSTYRSFFQERFERVEEFWGSDRWQQLPYYQNLYKEIGSISSDIAQLRQTAKTNLNPSTLLGPLGDAISEPTYLNPIVRGNKIISDYFKAEEPIEYANVLFETADYLGDMVNIQGETLAPGLYVGSIAEGLNEFNKLSVENVVDDRSNNYYVQPYMLTPSISDAWQQNHVMGEDSFMSGINRWNDIGVPPIEVSPFEMYKDYLNINIRPDSYYWKEYLNIDTRPIEIEIPRFEQPQMYMPEHIYIPEPVILP